jgi:hypothetical protein
LRERRKLRIVLVLKRLNKGGCRCNSGWDGMLQGAI